MPPPPDRQELDAFERQALEFLCAGEHPLLATLRAQLGVATVRAREDHPYGRWTDLWIEEDTPLIEHDERFAVDDLLVYLPGVSEPAQVLLHVNRGRMAMLEVSSVVGGWNPAMPIEGFRYARADPEAGGQLAEAPQRDVDFALRGWTR